MDLGGEWFNDVSGIQEQDRYLTLEEALERTRRNYMKAMLEAMLKETECQIEEDRLADLETETSCDDGKN